MKKMLVLALIVLAGAGTVMAQKKTTKSKTKIAAKIKAPALINASFTSSHPDVVAVKWSKTAIDNYIASYNTEAGVKGEIEYNKNSDVIKSRNIYTENNLPVEIASGIQNKYAGAIVKNAVKINLLS